MTIRRFFIAAVTAFSFAFLVDAESSRETTLIPQTLYIGDRGRLMVVLDSVLLPSGKDSVVVDRSELLPRSGTVHVHRVEIERRQGSVRALVDFTAFAPGEVEIPAVEIGGVRLAGFRVKIESVLKAGEVDPSPAEEALAAPGTFVLIYGGIFALLAAAALAFFLAARGIPALRAYFAARTRGRAARSLRRLLSRLRDEGAETDGERFFNALFVALRTYLSARTGLDCRALTSSEYRSALGREDVTPHFSDGDLSFLENLFRRGDEVRFGSLPMKASERGDALDRVTDLIDRLEAAA